MQIKIKNSEIYDFALCNDVVVFYEISESDKKLTIGSEIEYNYHRYMVNW